MSADAFTIAAAAVLCGSGSLFVLGVWAGMRLTRKRRSRVFFKPNSFEGQS